MTYASSFSVAPASIAPLKCFSRQGFDRFFIESAKQLKWYVLSSIDRCSR